MMKIDTQTYFDVVRLIFENAADGFCIICTDGIIQWHNVAFANLFGFVDENIIGNNISIIMPETIAKDHTKYIQKYLSTQSSQIIGTGRQVIAKKQDGSLFSIYLSVTESFIDGTIYFIGVMHKTTISHDDIETKINQLEHMINEWQQR